MTMKYVVLLCDGMADLPLKELGGKTPLEVAKKSRIDFMSRYGKVGLVKTVPDNMSPGSDVANLSVMGYDPQKYYTGRAPLEALNIGINLADNDIAVRCNLVTLSDENIYSEKTMIDYSSGEISSSESKILIEDLNKHFNNEKFQLSSGVSYRNILKVVDAKLGTIYTPPHDISDKKITQYLPKGIYGELLTEMMKESYNFLSNHKINKIRIEKCQKPANSVWFWGEGSRPTLPDFKETFGLKGAVISAVDLLNGIGKCANLDTIKVDGATGNIHTNFRGKAEACVNALKDGYDFVYLHIEAPDECGHQGDLQGKISSIEKIDNIVVAYLLENMHNFEYRILILPDHPTPISIKTHTSDAVPYLIFSSEFCNETNIDSFTEKNAKNGKYIAEGHSLMKMFINEKF